MRLLAPKRFCCRLCFAKQPSSSTDHSQGGKNKNKTKPGSRSLKGSIWTELRVGNGSRAWPCLVSAVPIAARGQPARLFLHLGKIWGLTRASKMFFVPLGYLGSKALQLGVMLSTGSVHLDSLCLHVQGWLWGRDCPLVSRSRDARAAIQGRAAGAAE